jgi:hypothetical protein
VFLTFVVAVSGWLKALLPKSAFIVEEKAWNAYPYTRTRYTCPFIEKFSLDIETVYREDCGDIENVFKLSKSELNERAVGKSIEAKNTINVHLTGRFLGCRFD